jgi:hypothetical protein
MTMKRRCPISICFDILLDHFYPFLFGFFWKFYSKRILKDFGEEGLSEGLTTFFQETQDKINKGEPIDLVKLARQIGESALLGGVTGAGITSAGAGFGKVKKSIAGEALLTNALITSEDREALEKIRDYNDKKISMIKQLYFFLINLYIDIEKNKKGHQRTALLKNKLT